MLTHAVVPWNVLTWKRFESNGNGNGEMERRIRRNGPSWWRDGSDGTARTGGGTESDCPIDDSVQERSELLFSGFQNLFFFRFRSDSDLEDIFSEFRYRFKDSKDSVRQVSIQIEDFRFRYQF